MFRSCTHSVIQYAFCMVHFSIFHMSCVASSSATTKYAWTTSSRYGVCSSINTSGNLISLLAPKVPSPLSFDFSCFYSINSVDGGWVVCGLYFPFGWDLGSVCHIFSHWHIQLAMLHTFLIHHVCCMIYVGHWNALDYHSLIDFYRLDTGLGMACWV